MSKPGLWVPRRGIIAASLAGGAGGVTPPDVGWTDTWDVADAGVADGAAVALIPNGQDNGRDMVQATGANQPIYRAEVAEFGGKPAIEGNGSRWLSVASVPTPLAMVVIGRVVTPTVSVRNPLCGSALAGVGLSPDASDQRVVAVGSSNAPSSSFPRWGNVTLPFVAVLDTDTGTLNERLTINGVSWTVNVANGLGTDFSLLRALGASAGTVQVAWAGLLPAKPTDAVLHELYAFGRDHFGVSSRIECEFIDSNHQADPARGVLTDGAASSGKVLYPSNLWWNRLGYKFTVRAGKTATARLVGKGSSTGVNLNVWINGHDGSVTQLSNIPTTFSTLHERTGIPPGTYEFRAEGRDSTGYNNRWDYIEITEA